MRGIGGTGGDIRVIGGDMEGARGNRGVLECDMGVLGVPLGYWRVLGVTWGY